MRVIPLVLRHQVVAAGAAAVDPERRPSALAETLTFVLRLRHPDAIFYQDNVAKVVVDGIHDLLGV